MPKPKLSEEKRSALRGEIDRALKAGTPKARIYTALAKKYGVSPETIRYYVKGRKKKSSATPTNRATQGSTQARGKQNGPRKAKKVAPGSGRKTSVKGTSNGFTTLRVRDAVKGLTAQDLERALEARKLLPELEASRARASDLRVKAREAERQAAGLERQFKKLVR